MTTAIIRAVNATLEDKVNLSPTERADFAGLAALSRALRLPPEGREAVELLTTRWNDLPDAVRKAVRLLLND